MSTIFTRSLAVCAAMVLTLASIGVITTVPPAYASPLAPMIA